MNTINLKTFLVLAQTKSFTKTSQALYIAQSTVSDRIKDLENQLGTPLFRRGNRSATLTPAGKALQFYAEKILDLEGLAISEVNMSGKYSGILHISVTHNLFDCHIEKLIHDFLEKVPPVSIEVSILHSEEILSSIVMGGFDICFAYSPYHHPDYVCEPFINDVFTLVTSPDNANLPSSIRSDEIPKLPLIYSDIMDISYDWLLIPQSRLYPISINVLSKAIPLLKRGKWFCLIPRQTVAKELSVGELVEIPIEDLDVAVIPSYVIYKKRTTAQNECLAKLVDMVHVLRSSLI